jgi:translation elongation factor EF-G
MGETQVEKTQTFEEKMKARIKDGIGDLLSDDEVKKLIDRGMEEVFMKDQIIRDTQGYSSRDKIKPCLLHEIVKEMMQPAVNEAVKAYILEHPEEVQAAVTKVIEDGMGKAVLSGINNFFSSSLFNFQNQVVQQIQNMPRQ